MVFFPDPRLDYKPTSKALFRHGSLLDELRDIRRHHASPANQAIHIISMTLFFIFVASTAVLVLRLFTFPLPILVFLVIVFFPVPYIGFYWYLDPVVAIFWMPIFVVVVVGSVFIADKLTGLMPLDAAIPLSFALVWLALLPQFIGHLLFEKVRSPLFQIFEVTIMTAFFLGYCGVGWMSCWQVRKETTEKIWKEEESPNSPNSPISRNSPNLVDVDRKDLEP